MAGSMGKPTIAIVVTAALCSAAACKGNEIERKAEDVREARTNLQGEQQGAIDDIRDAKEQLRKVQADLSIAIQDQINDVQNRLTRLEARVGNVTDKLDPNGIPAAQIHQQQELARAKIDAARSSDSPADTQQALRDARDALDKLEDQIDQFD